jgi:hypothetical protein
LREKYATDFGRKNMLPILAGKYASDFDGKNILLVFAGKFDPNFGGKIGEQACATDFGG